MVHAFFKRPLRGLALAAAAVSVHASAHAALTFVFNDVGTTPMEARFMTAFQQAGSYWSGVIGDPVTIRVDVAFDALPPGVLGSASSGFAPFGYSTVRTALLGDARSTIDNSAVASLQSSMSLGFLSNAGSVGLPPPVAFLDADGSPNNSTLLLTRANAKAIGLLPPMDAGTDARITFASGFASSFVTDRSGGVPGNMLDFNTVARHEIAHVLGFASGVDLIDECAESAGLCQLGTAGFHGDAWLMALDLFRYSAPGQLDARVGGSPYLSVDGGVTSVASFSTGVKYGNGWQASHFGTGAANLMRAFINYGEAYDATGNDLTALDAIGWDLTVAVPEPSTWALMLLGVFGLAGWTRRHRA